METQKITPADRYRPLLAIASNEHTGTILLQTSLAKGISDNSSFAFNSKNLSIIPNKYKIETDNERLTALYVQLVKTPDIKLTDFILTIMAYNGFIFKPKTK